MFNKIVKYIKKRENILRLEKLYEAVVPGVIKNNRTFNKIFFRLVIGEWFDVDFKNKYQSFKLKDWAALYNQLYINRIREEDISGNQKKYVLLNLSGNTILDVGCGTGIFCEEIVASNSKYQVTGCDLSSEAIADSQRRTKKQKRIKFRVENITKLSFKNNYFDTVICCHVIEHAKEFQLSLSELIRIAKKRVIIIVPEEHYKQYSPDYHVNYFNEKNSLENYFPKTVKVVKSALVDQDRCWVIDKL